MSDFERGNKYTMRPPNGAEGSFAERQQTQMQRQALAEQANRQKMYVLERKQREAEQLQKQAEQVNRAKGLGMRAQPEPRLFDPMGLQNLSQPAQRYGKNGKIKNEDIDTHLSRSKLMRPAIFGILDEFGNPIDDGSELDKLAQSQSTMIEAPPSARMSKKSSAMKSKKSSRKPDYSDDEIDEKGFNQFDPRAEEIRKQNEAIRQHLERIKKQNDMPAKASKFKDELEKLNSLEGRMYDFNRHLDQMHHLNRLGDDLNRMARNQALSTIKTGQIRKDKAIQDAVDAITGEKRKRRKDKKSKKRGYESTYDEDTEDYERKKRKKNKIKRLNEELALAKAQANNNQPMMNKNEVEKLVEDALLKNKTDIEKMAEEMGANAEDVVTLPNGVTMIKSRDPTKPPMYVMPENPSDAIRKAFRKSNQSVSSTSSISESMPEKPNPLQQMMLGMLMQKNMQMMLGGDQSSQSSYSSRRNKHSKRSPPIIIPQQPMFPPISQPRRVSATPVQAAPVVAQTPALPPMQPAVDLF